jgi:hypothetical protein
MYFKLSTHSQSRFSHFNPNSWELKALNSLITFFIVQHCTDLVEILLNVKTMRMVN